MKASVTHAKLPTESLSMRFEMTSLSELGNIGHAISTLQVSSVTRVFDLFPEDL
jgi:hypothetical protein